jgi:hypothetical protein
MIWRKDRQAGDSKLAAYLVSEAFRLAVVSGRWQ